MDPPCRPHFRASFQAASPLQLLCISPTLTPFLSAIIASQMHHLPSQSTPRIVFFPGAALSSQDDVSRLWLPRTTMSYVNSPHTPSLNLLRSPATQTYYALALELSWANTWPEGTCGKTHVVDLEKKYFLFLSASQRWIKLWLLFASRLAISHLSPVFKMRRTQRTCAFPRLQRDLSPLMIPVPWSKAQS